MNKVYAIADIHGMYSLWRSVIESLDETDTLYVLGDCGDRGPEGWKIIREALADPRVIYIRGNHDQMLLNCWKDDWCDNYLWYSNGGWATYESMLMDVDYEKYLIQLARTKLYHCYINKEGQRIHLSHAGFTLMENDELPNKRDLLWDRDHIDDHCDWWPESNPTDYVVHGHSYCASKSCFGLIDTELNDSHTVGRYCHGHKICIDGRSFLSNKIAILDLDTLQEIVIKIDKLEILY
jgi:predicted phosphodiesterase